MSPTLVMVGANFRTAPLATRERLAVPRSRRTESLLTVAAAIRAECFWVATCNRSEVYAFGEPGDLIPRLTDYLAGLAGIGPAPTSPVLYAKRDADCAHHLFRVAAGLDSLVLGEFQILGQLKEALMEAREAGTLGLHTEGALRSALKIGRRARSETGISRGAGSVSSAAIRLAQRVCGSLADRRVLVVGAGEVAELVAQSLLGAGAGRLMIVNRSPHRAARLAERFGGRALPYERTSDWLREADVVITSTDAPHAVLTQRLVQRARQGIDEPLCVIDLAVPRDVEPGVADLPGVSLANVDDLESVVERDLAGRAQATSLTEALVATGVAEYQAWLAARRAVPDVVAFRESAHRIRHQEWRRWERRLRTLNPEERATVEAFGRSLVNKVLHEPTVRYKRAAANDGSAEYGAVLRDLFALNEPPLVTD